MTYVIAEPSPRTTRVVHRASTGNQHAHPDRLVAPPVSARWARTPCCHRAPRAGVLNIEPRADRDRSGFEVRRQHDEAG